VTATHLNLEPSDLEAIIGSHGGQMPNGLLAISFSRLSRYQQCGEAYKLQYVDKAVAEPGGAAIAGTICHEIIEEMVIDGWYRKPDVVEEYGADQFHARFPVRLEEEGGVPVLDPDGRTLDYEGIRWGGRKRALRDDNDKIIRDEQGKSTMVGENFPWFMKTAPTWLKRAGTILRDDERNGIVMTEGQVEMRVSAWLDGPGSTLIVGTIDAMLMEGPDGPIIRDWKTGSWMPGPMQLANYAWLLRNMEAEDLRIVADTGQMIYLRGSTKEQWVKQYDLTDQVPIVPRMFRDMLRGVEAGVYQLVPSNFCKSCWVREHCDYGKTLPE
jgi:hypothetical protein